VPAKFVVKKGVTGKFRFSLLSANGLVIASSQTYESKASCLAGLRAVQKNAAGAAIDDQTVAPKAAVTAKPAARKPAPKKTAAKKVVAKKAVAKKPVAKRPAAKKPSVKKPAARKK
jgi:uncharacterized protein YegP (UPF0339 family)